MFQRRREGEGRFRGDLAAKRGHLVHVLPIVPKARDCAREATRSEKARSSENA